MPRFANPFPESPEVAAVTRGLEVMVVDDDKLIRDVVRRTLEREGFFVVEASDGEEALTRSLQAPVDIAVVDIHMPKLSGYELVRQLRVRDPRLHVIMLTSAGTEAERVRGLVGGADDYVVKPFSPRELAARVVAAGRRMGSRTSPDRAPERISIDPVARVATVDGAPVDLTRREFDLLNFLAVHPGRTFTRPQLLHAVWESSAEWQSEATVTEHVRRLRTKVELDPLHPEHVVTVKGAGYRFDPGDCLSRPRGGDQ
jgi:two-component system phosphate regulon response regulator PhoB